MSTRKWNYVTRTSKISCSRFNLFSAVTSQKVHQPLKIRTISYLRNLQKTGLPRLSQSRGKFALGLPRYNFVSTWASTFTLHYNFKWTKFIEFITVKEMHLPWVAEITTLFPIWASTFINIILHIRMQSYINETMYVFPLSDISQQKITVKALNSSSFSLNRFNWDCGVVSP